MENSVFVLLHSHNTNGNNVVREIRGVFASKKVAVEAMLDEINQMYQYDEGPRNGRVIHCDRDIIELDETLTSHNGPVFKLTIPPSQVWGVRYFDDEDCPEWVREWEIEEHDIAEQTFTFVDKLTTGLDKVWLKHNVQTVLGRAYEDITEKYGMNVPY